jgi:pimeloyl-ACP methyl ester carboxylesterase
MKETQIRIPSKQGHLNVMVSCPNDVPVVGTLLCLHGGPGGDLHGPGNVFDEIRDIGIPLGYALIQFDMFGAGKSDGLPQEITLASQLDDFRAMREFAQTQFKAPLHIVGESMGATIASLDWFSGCSSYLLLWPAFDLRDTDLRPYLGEEWRPVLENTGYLSDNGIIVGKAFIDEILQYDFEPCFSLPDKPCLLVHGRGDRAVPFTQSIRAYSKRCGPSEFHSHPTADHGFIGEARSFALDAVKRWLLSHA